MAQQQSVGDSIHQADAYRLGINGVAQDEARAADLYRSAAEHGSAEGQMRYGEALFEGRGVTRDRDAARAWLEKAAAQKLPRAEADLGSLWLEGLGVKLSRETALEWFRRAAAHGDAYAEWKLGQFAEYGWAGQAASIEAAYGHYLKAADGSPWGMVNIAGLNFAGRGVAKNIDEALKWYVKAASIQDPELIQAWNELRPDAVAIDIAIFQLARIYQNGNGVVRDQAKADQWNFRGVAMEKPAASAGWPMAEIAYGNDFNAGTGVAKDQPQAMVWYLKAANQAYAPAQVQVGYAYQNGQGVQQDYGQAMTWYRKAADLGNAVAQIQIALLYYNGLGVPHDYRQAITWFRKAADQGNLTAQVYIGGTFDRGGFGVPQDYAQAMAWYRKAADQGNANAQDNIGWLYQNGRGVPQDFVQATIWHRKAADQGYAPAQYALGVLYQSAPGAMRDYGQALSWYRKAADQGHVQSQYVVGVFYENGWGVTQDYPQAIAWYHKAADLGSAQAQSAIGWLYENGQGVAQDYAQAMVWYRKAADQGNSNAENTVGAFYRMGRAGAKDPAQAMSWFRKAADQGDVNAEYNIGSLYENGEGVPPDLQMARFWYAKSADQGNQAAKDALAKLGVSKPAGITVMTSYDRNMQAIVAKQNAAASAGQTPQPAQGSGAQDAKRRQMADLQSKIDDLKDDADVSERAAENFDEEAQSLQGPAAIMARSFATQKRQEAQRTNRQISDLQSQMQLLASQPAPAASAASAAPAASAADTGALVRASAAPPAATSSAARASGTAPAPTVDPAASSCWSSELDEINDPVVRARMGNNVVPQTIQIAQTGGAAALDQQIAQLQQEQSQAENGIRTANADIAAIAQGPPPQVNPRICATMGQSGNPSAIMAAMCYRLTMQNTLHLASGLIEVMQCVRQSIR